MENELQDHSKYRKNCSCEFPLPSSYHKRAIKRWNLWNIAILQAQHYHNLWHKENADRRRRHLDIVHGRRFADDVRGHTNSDEQQCLKNDFIFYRELLPLIICAVLIFILYVSIGCIIGRRKTRSSLQANTFVIMFSYRFGRLFSQVT